MSDTNDYYAILGVNPSASAEEIRAAHKREYVRWHPDRAPKDKKAEYQTRCKKINQAYSVLSDPKARAAYDAQRAGYGHDIFGDYTEIEFNPFESTMFNDRYERRVDLRTLHVTVSVQVTPEQLYYGDIVKHIAYTRRVDCYKCGGTMLISSASTCRYCQGRGYVTPTLFGLITTKTICRYCKGRGKQLVRCTVCRQSGQVEQKVHRTLKLDVSLVRDKVRYDGEGHRAGEYRGDLILQTTCKFGPQIYIYQQLLTILWPTTYQVLARRQTINVRLFRQVIPVQLPATLVVTDPIIVPNRGLRVRNGRGDLRVLFSFGVPRA